MWVIKRRVIRYAREHDALPTTLNDLPKIPQHGDEVTDWWGNPIRFEVSGDGIATLSSPGGPVWGRDPREGAPIACRFPTKTDSGDWCDEMVPFIRE
jgi:hypothetical protein